MRSAISRMFDLMSPQERRRVWWLLPVVMVNGVTQVVGIAAFMPFLALIASPEAIREQPLLRWAYEALGFTSEVAFLTFTGLVVLAALLLSNGAAALTHLLILRFSWNLHHTLAVRLLRAYLARPYVFFLDQNTATLVKNILGEVHRVVSGFLMHVLELVGRAVVTAFVVALLVVVDPVLAVLAFGVLGAAYGGLYLMVDRLLSQAGWRMTDADRARYKAAGEALSGVKEIKLLGREEAFLARYRAPDDRFVRNTVVSQVVATLPRYVFETVAFGAMLVVVVFLLSRGQGVATVLPVLGVFAFAAYRLLPTLQGIFHALTGIRFAVASVEVLHADLQDAAGEQPLSRDHVAPLPLTRSLALRDVTFAYPNADRPLLNGFDLEVPARTTVALVGTTGSGKTTVVDLVLGLLRPQSGALVVDGVAVDDATMPAWQSSLGYVPQVIYLADDTVAANIAFGVPVERIDIAAVERAARRAQIHDFIVEQLPKGYDTLTGERGIRLSGGQRQRLGIARALYHDPSVLILDEATSALDNLTEEAIFRAVTEIGREKTIIMIAHRISTVRECDIIFVLDHGRLVAQGSYNELLVTSPRFRELARARKHVAEVVAPS